VASSPILGANGAGKTTVLKTICGVMDPQKGSVVIRGPGDPADGSRQVMRLGVSHVPEGREVFPFLSVRENLRMGAYTRRDADGVAPGSRGGVRLFPGIARARRPARRLAVGRRAADAGDQPGLMARPRLMLLDEPSLGLSPKLVKDIFDNRRAHQPRAGRHHPAGRAERQHGAADRRFRLRAR